MLGASWYAEETSSFGVFTLKLMGLNLPRAVRVSMPRLQVWLHPIPVRPFPLMSVPLANTKIKPDTQFHTAPAESRGGSAGPIEVQAKSCRLVTIW